MVVHHLRHRYSNNTYPKVYNGPLEVVAKICQELGLETGWWGGYEGSPDLMISPRFDTACPRSAIGWGTSEGLAQESWDWDGNPTIRLLLSTTEDPEVDHAEVQHDDEDAIRAALTAMFL